MRAEADRREGLARLAGQVDTMRTRVESIDDTVARLSENIEESGTRAQQARAEFETVQSRVGELDAGEVGLDEHHDRTVAALRAAQDAGVHVVLATGRPPRWMTEIAARTGVRKIDARRRPAT